MKKLILYIIMSMFLITLVNAEMLPHTINEDLTFSFSDTLAINCNVSTIDSPNTTIWINQEMTKNGNTFNSTILKGNFTTTGIHCINIECINGYGSVCRDVTKTGTILSIEESFIYGVLGFGVFLLFILSFYFAIAIPYKNNVDVNSGVIIKITKLKYVKLGFFLLTWVSLTWFLNILIGLADNFVSLTMYFGFFSFIFNLMNRLALWVGLVVLVIMFFEIIRDSNLQKRIKELGGLMR